MYRATKTRRHARLACLIAALCATTVAHADLIVVVGASSSAAGMGKEQIADIFLGKSTALTPMDQAESSPLREEFYTKVTGKSAAQAKAIWSKLAFTGKGTPPKEGANSAEIKKALAANPNMVGYIEKSAADSSVKTLLAP
jgi:ABC-type phosphate transport system substrate-binding protein